MSSGAVLVENDENRGFAGGNNQLARLATSRWVAFLNPDAYPHADWVEKLMQATEVYPRIRFFGSTQYLADQPGFLDGCGDVYHAAGLAYRGAYQLSVRLLPPEGEVFAPCAAASMIDAKLFEELGGYDEDFFCYNEDVDLAFRARLIGEKVVQLRHAAVDHAGYSSSGRRSEFATYYGVRNRIWVFIKNMPGYLLPALMPFHLLANVLLWFSSFRFGQGMLFARAVWAAVRALPVVLKKRKEIQNQRTASTREIARILCWDSRTLLSRTPNVRPLDRGDR